MSDKVDKLFEEIEAEKKSQHNGQMAPHAENKAAQAPSVSASDEVDMVSRIQEERMSKISGFKLDLNLEDEYKEPSESSVETADKSADVDAAPENGTDGDSVPGVAEMEKVTPADEQSVNDPLILTPAFSELDNEIETVPAAVEKPAKKKKSRKKKPHTALGCIKGLIYALIVIGASGVLTYFAVTGGLDMMGMNKSEELIDVVVPSGATTEEIAELLKEKKIIEQPLIFRLFVKFTDAEDTFKPGTYTLSPSMGYNSIVNMLQANKPREIVRVMIPEGSTLDDIAAIMEKNDVCSATDFYTAAVKNDYSKDYDFIRMLPTEADGAQYAGRIYTLEGYLFPDTYEFYTKSSADSVIRKMLDNFTSDGRFDTSIRAIAGSKNMTIDQVVIMASIIQGEAAKYEDMLLVSRVLYNRLQNTAEYPQLQCDSTRDYVNSLIQQPEGMIQVINSAYDTYNRNGLPVGAINNPGMDAIRAALYPSDEPEAQQYYYFATDYKTQITYYSKTLKEHEAICEKYGIGMYGKK